MLFGFSTGDKITGYNVKSFQMLKLIEKVARANPKAIFFGFGFNFDVNFIFKDLPKHIAVRILKEKLPTHYGKYRFEFLDKKFLRITQKDEWTMTIYEVQGFFANASLINAYKDQIGEDKDFIEVQHGKGLRNVFTYEELNTLVLPYFEVEQRMYVRLMEHMRQLIIDADLPLPRDWYGPSALISKIYEKAELKQHLKIDRAEVLDSDYIRACQRSYFGGRFEQFQAGHYESSVWQYDIVSAYPSAMLTLWSWKNAHCYWINGHTLDRIAPMPAQYRYSVWDIQYSCSDRTNALIAPMPFPHRLKTGNVLFPHETRTTIWSPELEINWFNKDVEIIGGWVIEPQTDQHPFQFYSELFERRNHLKRIGNSAQYAIKIAINAGYGKVAQRVGAKNTDVGWRIPPYHQLDWAGYITSVCRAQIWRAITIVGWQNVISVETDGIFCTKPMPSDTKSKLHCVPSIKLGNNLGEWEEKRWDGMLTIQNGIYWLKEKDEWKKAKQRGLRRAGVKGIQPAEVIQFLERYYLDHSVTLSSPTTQFHGIGNISRPNYLTWTQTPKEIRFAANGKRQVGRDDRNPAKQLIRLQNGSIKLTEFMSHPHPLPWSQYGTMINKDQLADERSKLILGYQYE